MATSEPKFNISDSEILGLMLDGGHKICDYAIEQWTSGKYRMSPEPTTFYINEWKEKKRRITELVQMVTASGLVAEPNKRRRTKSG